jgi:hypothetical protein
MLYSVCKYTVQLYTDIYNGVKQLLQSICEISFCSSVTCFTSFGLAQKIICRMYENSVLLCSILLLPASVTL